jgi:hypothetical protein
MDKPFNLDDIAYIKVKKPEVQYWGHGGFGGREFAAPMLVRPEDITVVWKSELVWVREEERGPLIPADKYYNQNIDAYDTMHQDEGGRWVWTKSPGPTCRQPTIWTCTQCSQHKVMDCSCGIQTLAGLYVTRILEESEYTCTHKVQDPQFVCRACSGEVAERVPWGAQVYDK